MPDDMGLNKFLLDVYGDTTDKQQLFRLVWSTDQIEKRRGTFIDMYDNQFVRSVTEVRECKKYPFAEDRWVLETLVPVPEVMFDKELFTRYSYEGIYIFQSKDGDYLPLSREMLETAMYLYLVWARMEFKDRLDFRMMQLAEKEKAKKEHLRGIIGEEMRSPLFTVLESSAAFRKGRRVS